MKIASARPWVVESLRYALNPQRVAVVGASRSPEKIGYHVVRGLKEWNYQGEILPVNPRARQVQGLKAYSTLRDIPGRVDLVFIALPAHLLKMVLEDAVAANARMVAIASSGLKEAGRAGLQDDLTDYCRRHRLPMLGPNFLGLGSPYTHFNCGFIPYVPEPGPVAMISQSGANLLAALGASRTAGLGLSLFFGLGSKADVDFSECIAYAAEDPHTRAIAVYIEGLDSEEAFVAACREAAAVKPVVALKAGGSRIGARAAFAHTASESGPSDEHYDHLFEAAGVLRARTWEEFLDVALALGLAPPLTGDRVVMLTNGGGSGLLASDEFERRGMPLHEISAISPALRDRMQCYLPAFGSPLNPVDLAGTATQIQYRGTLAEALRDPHVDGVLVSVCPTAMTRVRPIADALLELAACGPPGKTVVAEFQGGAECDEEIVRLRKAGIPAYPTPERAVAALVALREYASIRCRL